MLEIPITYVLHSGWKIWKNERKRKKESLNVIRPKWFFKTPTWNVINDKSVMTRQNLFAHILKLRHIVLFYFNQFFLQKMFFFNFETKIAKQHDLVTDFYNVFVCTTINNQFDNFYFWKFCWVTVTDLKRLTCLLNRNYFQTMIHNLKK
jgi:hypothetical protein